MTKRIANYFLNERGTFLTSWAETDYVTLPATIHSSAGWRVDVHNAVQLRAALERHAREPGVSFDVEAVLAWASETEVDAINPQALRGGAPHAGIPDEFLVL